MSRVRMRMRKVRGVVDRPPLGKKCWDHPALKDKLEYEESGGYRDQPGIEAAKKSAYDDLPIGTVNPKQPRINNSGGHPDAKGKADENKRFVEQSLARFEQHFIG